MPPFTIVTMSTVLDVHQQLNDKLAHMISLDSFNVMLWQTQSCQ